MVVVVVVPLPAPQHLAAARAEQHLEATSTPTANKGTRVVCISSTEAAGVQARLVALVQVQPRPTARYSQALLDFLVAVAVAEMHFPVPVPLAVPDVLSFGSIHDAGSKN